MGSRGNGPGQGSSPVMAAGAARASWESPARRERSCNLHSCSGDSRPGLRYRRLGSQPVAGHAPAPARPGRAHHSPGRELRRDRHGPPRRPVHRRGGPPAAAPERARMTRAGFGPSFLPELREILLSTGQAAMYGPGGATHRGPGRALPRHMAAPPPGVRRAGPDPGRLRPGHRGGPGRHRDGRRPGFRRPAQQLIADRGVERLCLPRPCRPGIGADSRADPDPRPGRAPGRGTHPAARQPRT